MPKPLKRFRPTSGLTRRATSVAAAPAPTIGTPATDQPEPEPPKLMPVKQDDAFLHLMIEHQKAGLKIAHVQVANGKRPEVTKVAQSMIIKHNAEIDRLKKLKGK